MGRPEPGARSSIALTVTPEMTARLFDREIHPVYATAWMVRHVEEAGRLLVEGELDPDEDATGYRIELTHERPASVGERLRVEAVVVEADERQCVADAAVLGSDGRVIGRARFVQRYVRRGLLGPAERAHPPHGEEAPDDSRL